MRRFGGEARRQRERGAGIHAAAGRKGDATQGFDQRAGKRCEHQRAKNAHGNKGGDQQSGRRDAAADQPAGGDIAHYIGHGHQRAEISGAAECESAVGDQQGREERGNRLVQRRVANETADQQQRAGAQRITDDLGQCRGFGDYLSPVAKAEDE